MVVDLWGEVSEHLELLLSRLPVLEYLSLALLCLLLSLPLELVYNFAHYTEKLPKPKAPSLDPHTPYEDIYECPVANAEGKKNTKVSPLLAGLDVECGEIIVSGCVRTVHATTCGFRVQKVARGLLQEVAGIAGAVLTGWCVKLSSLLRSTFNWNAIECCCKNATDPIGCGAEGMLAWYTV